MPQLKVPLGSMIQKIRKPIVKIRIPNTSFWIYGERNSNYLWNAYIVDNYSKQKKLLKHSIPTNEFSLFSNIVLNKQLQYEDKRKKDFKQVIKFINSINKKYKK